MSKYRGSTPRPAKKKKKNVAKGKLSFGLDDEEEAAESATSTAAATPRSGTPDENGGGATSEKDKDGVVMPKKKLGANSNVAFKPKVMTKSALLREAQQREQLRKEFLIMQEAVKATDFVIPFVFYDGTNIPGGKCKIKKGEHVWLFLDKARKVGAELGVGGDKSRREWARVGVDDLMLVRGEIIIPHVSVGIPIRYDLVLTSASTTTSITSWSTKPLVSPDLSLPIPHNPQTQLHCRRKTRILTRRHSILSKGRRRRRIPGSLRRMPRLKAIMTTLHLLRSLIGAGMNGTNTSFRRVSGRSTIQTRTIAKECGRMRREILSSSPELFDFSC